MTLSNDRFSVSDFMVPDFVQFTLIVSYDSQRFVDDFFLLKR